jgi:hypothetical protein
VAERKYLGRRGSRPYLETDSTKFWEGGRYIPFQGRPVVPRQYLQGFCEFEVVPRPVNIGFCGIWKIGIGDFAKKYEGVFESESSQRGSRL